MVLERGPDLSFANCGLPYYLGGEIQQRSKLLVTPLERLKVRYKLDARPHSEVTRIDRAGKRVLVRDRATGREYLETYDKLILSPGAKPRVPDVPGGDLPGVFTLRTLEDTDRIFARLKDVRHAVLMGGGFISLEVAENLAHRGIGVTVVERNAQLLMPFDPEMTTPLVKALRAKGGELILGGKVARILPGAPTGQHLVAVGKCGLEAQQQVGVSGAQGLGRGPLEHEQHQGCGCTTPQGRHREPCSWGGAPFGC